MTKVINTTVTEIRLTSEQFKIQVLNAMARNESMPMVCLWWNDTNQWCFAVAETAKVDKIIRRNVGQILFQIMGELNLLDQFTKNKKD